MESGMVWSNGLDVVRLGFRERNWNLAWLSRDRFLPNFLFCFSFCCSCINLHCYKMKSIGGLFCFVLVISQILCVASDQPIIIDPDCNNSGVIMFLYFFFFSFSPFLSLSSSFSLNFSAYLQYKVQ